MNPEDLAEFYGKDESKVPFEYLDPCCQREILEKRHYNEVGDRLRREDRSQVRFDAQRTVFSNLGLGSIQCGCCRSNEDYAALRRLRKQLGEEEPTALDVRRDDDEDDDDDSLLDEDIPLTPDEQARMAALAQQMRRREMAEQSVLMLGKHVDESLPHVLSVIKKVPDLPVVLHVYEDEVFSAMVDFLLEELAIRHLGTWFRRLPCAQALPYDDAALQGVDSQVIDDLNALMTGDRA
eukprot:gene46678-57166_t